MGHKGHAGEDSLLPPLHLTVLTLPAFGSLQKRQRQHNQKPSSQGWMVSSPLPQKKIPKA